MKSFWIFYTFIIFGLSMAATHGSLTNIVYLFPVNFILYLIPALLIFAIIRRFNKKPVAPAEPPAV
jgi:Ca2+/Na+ antiporter